MADLDVLVVGDCNPDLVLYGDVEPAFGQAERVVGGAALVIGGSAGITAAGLARLGLSTGLAGVLGDDVFGHFMRDALADRGVQLTAGSLDPALPTGLSVVLDRSADRAILTAPGAIPALTADRIDRRLLATTRHVHVSSYFLLPGLRHGLGDVLRQARSAGATVSLDPGWDPAETWDGGLRRLLPALDLLLPNEEEARRIAGSAGLEAAMRELARAGPTVVAKRGPRGALAIAGAGGRRMGAGERSARSVVSVAVPAVPGPVVDSIGAGDSFAAGLLAGLLGGRSLELAMALGCACGAASTRSRGGTAGQPTLAEADRLAGLAA